MSRVSRVGCLFLSLVASFEAIAVEHPSLIMTQAGVERIREHLGSVPLFDATVSRVKAQVDAEIENGIDTPIPKDFSGGYTHDRHKQNFLSARDAGLLYQILEDARYATYVRDMLLQYEAMYPSLPVHPQTRSYARGKLFWQCLNDSNWLVYMSQAYDLVYDSLTPEDRERLEANLFRPFADYISIENPQFYNRIHNHSTWGNAAVGMIGLVMDDDALVQRALYGIEDARLDSDARDNDGGFIKVAGQKAGFLANLEQPFSPDGYYTEGPYYQRYAMYPFLVFAQAMQNVRPQLDVFAHKDRVLEKAVQALLSLSDAHGEFFPLNDGQKGMSYYARELITAVDVAYHFAGEDPELLSIAEAQGEVLLDDTGIAVALAVREGKSKPFDKKSINLSDGPEGDQGGVAVLRQRGETLTLVFKYSAQGLSHGHYDKLSFSLYERGEEVLQDYGLVRFVNVGQKGGGNYLPENRTWAKQTIAHNTITQDEISHFQGKYEIGSRHHSELRFFDASRNDIKVVSATESNAYPGTQIGRTMALLDDDTFEKPIVLDVLSVASDSAHQYDVPFYFHGQVLQVNFAYESPSVLAPLGANAGYRHLYLEAIGQPSDDNTRFSWMHRAKFYSLTTLSEAADELMFTRLGANDPAFNLRRDAAFMIRRRSFGRSLFVSVIESHGSYSPVSELAISSKSELDSARILYDDERYTAVLLGHQGGRRLLFIQSNAPGPSAQGTHKLALAGVTYEWVGPYYYAALSD